MKVLIKRTLLIGIIVIGFIVESGKTSAQDLSSALKMTKSEKYEDANAAFEALIKQNPNNSDLYFYYGENMLKDYDSDPYSNTLDEVCKNAKTAFEDGLKVDSLNPLDLVGIGMVILLQNNDTITADVYFNKAEKQLPRRAKKYTDRDVNTLIKLGLAQLYAKNPRYKKAIAYLEKIKEIKPDNTDIYMALGDVYINENDASEAIKNYNQAVYKNPKLISPLVKIGTLYMRSRNLNEAKNYFEQAKEMDSTFAPLYRGLGEMYSMGGLANLSKQNFKIFLDLSGNNIPAKVQYVNSLFKAREYKEAIENIEDILTVDKSRTYLYRVAAYSCYEMKPPDYPKARTYIETFFKNSPHDKIIIKDYEYYGRILLRLKDTSLIDKAFEELMKAYKLDSTDNDLIADISINAYYSKRFSLAAQMLSRKITIGKANSNDYIYLGKTYYQMAQAEKSDSIAQKEDYMNADKAFTELAQKEPNNIQAYLWTANTYAAMDPNSKQGLAKPKYETVIEKAISDTVKNAQELYEAYSYLASYYLISKDFPNSIVYSQKIVSLDPTKTAWQIKGNSLLAGIYHTKKEYPKALYYYEKVYALDSRNEDIKKTIEAMKKTINAMREQ